MRSNHFKKVCKPGVLFVLLICNAAFSLSITHGPYLVDQTETAVTIVWFSDAESIGGVEYGTGGNFNLKADDAIRGIMRVGTRHVVRLTGLTAGAEYNYRVTATEITSYSIYFPVSGSTVRSSENTFTTFNTKKEEITFYYLTDTHNSNSAFSESLERADWDKGDFLVSGGDHFTDLSASSTDRIFSGFVDPWTQSAGKSKSFYLARGNHEYRGSMTPHIIDYVPSESGEFYYTFSHGHARFLLFDTGEDKSDSTTNLGGVVAVQPYLDQEYAWFKNYVQSHLSELAEIPFKIGFVHQPRWGYQAGQNGRWDQLANDAGMDLVLAGHTHSFSHWRPSSSKKFHTVVVGQNQLCKVIVTRTKAYVTVVSSSNGSEVTSFTIDSKVPVSNLPHTAFPAFMPADATYKVTGGKLILSRAYNGKRKSIAVYSLNGKLLYRTVSTDRVLSLKKDYRMADGIHIVHIKVLPDTK
jgi:predicted phosphodiesterase